MFDNSVFLYRLYILHHVRKQKKTLKIFVSFWSVKTNVCPLVRLQEEKFHVEAFAVGVFADTCWGLGHVYGVLDTVPPHT